MLHYLTSSVDVEQVRHTFIVHGEPDAQSEYKDHLYESGFRNISIPHKGELVEL
jgi:hypothetical protein